MSEPNRSFRLSLAWKVTLAFGFVVLAALVAFSFLANRAAAREVRGFMFSGGVADNALLAENLAAYYRLHGSWEGVAPLLVDPSPWRRMMRAMGPHMEGPGGLEAPPGPTLSNVDGLVIAGPQPAGQRLSPTDLASGTPIQVGDQVVGLLIVAEPSGSSLAESLIGRVTRGTWLVAGLTGLAALLAGGLLVSGLLRPVRELTAASRALARGELGRRVPVRSQDEVGELSTAFNQMAESLEQAEHVRRELTADIAHELRNPLAVLQANLEALSDGVYPAKAENFAPAIDQIHLLNRLVEDLRTLALADAGQLELALVQTNLLDLARRVAESYEQQAAEADVAVRVDGEPVAARADPMRVEQILGNLIGNAIRHTGRGHAVLVRAGPSGDQAELVVSDQGPGIAEEDLPRIFERFYRAERSRSRAEGGTGLGLAIARQLAALQGGEVRAANRLQGGAEFTLVLPRWREA